MIEAKIIADSISPDGIRLTTFEVLYPRWILAELNTHRVFSRSAASTRAVPIKKQLEYILDNPAMPVFFGRNQKGMQSSTPLEDSEVQDCHRIIKETLGFVAGKVEELSSLGLHKQHSGRYLEPWMHVKSVITATEYDNFFALRRHKDAQPEIQELANCMWQAREQSSPQQLAPRQWHLPYFEATNMVNTWESTALKEDGSRYTLDEAIKISASCCAQISYRSLDTSIEKAMKIYDALVTSKPVHASPFEHLGTPMVECTNETMMNAATMPSTWQAGVTHMDKNYNLWSGNFKGWVQYRQLIPGHVVNHYEED